MSKEKKDKKNDITKAVSQMVEVMKIQVSNSLVENSKELNLDQSSLKKLNYVITEIITSSYVNSVENIIKASK